MIPMAAVNEVLQKCSEALERRYGSALRGLVVYGSTARKQDTPASDIDLLVLLNEPFDYFQELRDIIDVLYPIQLESDRLISAKPALAEDFDKGTISLYRTAKREGTFV
jgi:predicted nucleotidyltransferase